MKFFTDMAMEAARVATGRMGWEPDRFWSATAAEFCTAVEGMLGVKPQEEPVTGVELARLREKFPDG